jgi:hypothetical protein
MRLHPWGRPLPPCGLVTMPVRLAMVTEHGFALRREAWQSKKRQFDHATAVNCATEGVWLTLRDACADKKGSSRNQLCRIKRLVTKETEIQGFAVSEM